MTAREAALKALITFRREGTWPDLYLKKACAGMTPEDAGLTSALTYGVLQHRAYLDFLIGSFSSRPVEKLTPQLLDALRLGAYQLVFLSRIPERAAVNETVNLVKMQGNPAAGNFANGVLRSLVRSKNALPQVPREPLQNYLAITYSHPLWFVGKMLKRLGNEGCQALLQANNSPFPVTARVNTLKTSRDALLKKLEAQGIAAFPHEFLPNAVCFDTMKGVLHSGLLEQGLLYIQDTASQLCLEALQPLPGETVFDLCAAPGGKSLLAGQMMENQGQLLSMELHPHRADLIAKNAEIYGISILQTLAADASVQRDALKERADAVICDVPCSGMGVIRKKPDVRYKDGDSIKVLPPLQLSILKNAGAALKPGGRLVYSTCTVLKEENESVVQQFLKECPGFSLEPFALPGIGAVPEGMLTLWSHIHGTDGFFIAKIRKD